MKIIFVALVLVGLVSAFTEEEYKESFINWMHENGRMYTAEEFGTRYANFKWNMDYVTKWNSENTMTVLGLNVFADLSNSEYQSLYLGTRFDGTERLANAEPFTLEAPLADDVDWRAKGAVTPIKNQGQCGSCWSFSTTGSVEGVHFLDKNELVSLSEQNLMDCSTAYGNQGCNGGLMDSAFKYIIANKGVDTEDSYPYTARNGQCHFNAANVGATISSYKDVSAGQEPALMAAIMKQPVSVAIDAAHSSFQLYKSGVYYERLCSSSRLDHGVLAVGYGSDGTSDYYIVKNSWGTTWGNQGYILMSRNKNNNCGIATMASYPVA